MTQPWTPWWGRFAVGLGQTLRVTAGPMTLTVLRRPWEWRIWREQAADAFASGCAVELLDGEQVRPVGSDEVRLTFAETADPLWLAPALADRPLVAHTETPLSVLPGESVVAFVTTPLWYRFSVGEPPRFCGEAPTSLPRDTWFGPSTREGELCYASRTKLYVDKRRLQPSPARAITPVRLVNSGDDVLVVQRILVPVPQLSLLRASTGRLWTSEIRLLREKGGLSRASVHPPALPGEQMDPVAGPRLANPPPRLLDSVNNFARGWWG